jgi:hypothetical protein
MKTPAMILFIIMVFPTMISAQMNQEDLIGKKIRSCTKMRNTGMVITTAGGLLTIAGVFIYNEGVNTAYKSDRFPYFDQSDGPEKELLGILCIAGGICTSFTGSIFWTIGSSKKNQYKEKLNSLSLKLSPDPRNALTLSLRF